MREEMGLFIDKVISSVIETILFALLPFIWWLATVKGEITFTQWTGIKKVEKGNRAGTVKMTVCTAMPFLLLSIFLFYMLKGTQTATAEFRGMGVKALPAVFVYAFFNTAFPEEILFRGFLLKRLKNKLGFWSANIIQSVLFGALHGGMFFFLVGTGNVKTVTVTVFTGASAWIMGYINEEKADGSILPGWIMHGIANTVSAVVSMFSVV